MKTKETTLKNYVKKEFNVELKESEFKTILNANRKLKEYHNSLNSVRRSIIELYNDNKLDNFCPLSFDIVLNMKKPEVYNYFKDNCKQSKNGYSFFKVLLFIKNNKETLQGLK